MKRDSLIKKIIHKFHPVRLFERAKTSYVEFHAHSSFKIRFVSWIGVIGFPAYYIIWTYVFPQDYENLTLRAIGTILFLGLILSEYWPRFLGKYKVLYSYVTLTYGLPFFFSTMLLMNNSNTVWQLSAMAALLFIVLLYDAINIFIATIIGSAFGYLFYITQTDMLTVPDDLLMALPVFAFTFLGFVFLNYSDDIIAKAKLNAAATLASHIAHEMRTPLLGIQLEAQKVANYIPKFMDCYHWAKQQGWKGERISKNQLTGFSGSMRRIKEHSASANLMIDMLLMNVRYHDIPDEDFAIHSARATVMKAIDRYHFRAGEDLLVSVEGENDFEYWGADVLLIHVLFNLMRNSFRAIHAKGQGAITVSFTTGTNTNSLHFRDSGQGMTPEVLNYAFVPFFSGEQSSGAGVGLSFTKYVVESFGGSISCDSMYGEGTEFVISLPKIHTNMKKIEQAKPLVTARE